MKKYKLLIVEDDTAALFGYERSLKKTGYSVETVTSLRGAKQAIATSVFHAMLLDLKLPDGNSLKWIPNVHKNYPSMAIIVISGIGNIQTAVKATKYGAENFLTKPIELRDLKTILEKALEVHNLRKNNFIFNRLSERHEPCFGSSKVIKEMLNNALIGSSNDTIILLQGETGTGKGVLARWIHEHSNRKSEPFVHLNCSSLKGDLLRSELFGHIKGAFTGAQKDREGLVEVADEGTLFLDEIGDMEQDVQAQFLTTIEERSFRRIGENKVRKSDFRLICATNKNLLHASQTGKFRKDLYFRLCIFPINIPPLRERKEDIRELIDYFLQRFGYSYLPLKKDVYAFLAYYNWPGNVRELRNMLERALLISKGEHLTRKHFPGLDTQGVCLYETETSELQKLAVIEMDYIKKVLKYTNNDKKRACSILGISLSALYRRLEKYKLATDFR